MLGSREQPALHTKGHETKCMIPFARGLVGKFQKVLGEDSQPLAMAGDCLLSFDRIVSAHGANLPLGAQQVPQATSQQKCAM
eukprot:2374999-Alexandrium_andersonii.AAC.1